MWWQSEMCPSVWQSSQKGTPAERSLGTFWCIDPVSTKKKCHITEIQTLDRFPKFHGWVKSID